MGSSGSRPSVPGPNAASTSNLARKNKQNFLVPILRSMSCGTSSWRTDNFMHESSIISGDHLACQITSAKSTVSDVQSGPFGLQRSDESSSDTFSAVSYQSLPDSGELTDSSLLNGHNSSILDSSRSSFPGQRSRYCHKAARISRSQRLFARDTPTNNDCFTIHNASCADIPSNQLTSEGDEINAGLSLGSISRLEDTPGYISEQENSANLADSGRPTIPLQDGSHNTSSLEDTFSTQHPNDLTALQVETSILDAQTLDTSSGISRRELSGREARRNNGRRLWDALTRASSRRRRVFSPLVLANEDIVGLRTVNDEWGLFDWNSSEDSGSFSYENGRLSRRSADMEERRWRARPQLWALQHFNNPMEGSSGQSRRCASGRHPNGHCACEAFVMTEEWSTRASISRIVMLAEALFEVLDEIHRQSVTLSSSTPLSLISSPAPESVVDSFAVRIHKKCDTSVLGQCAECHICLIEYEEGDHIRVLPCCHEFHMSCVDRWLKEAHRVCPLCRHNVCEETGRS